jgi:dolichol-phosphate mannosyltransferase
MAFVSIVVPVYHNAASLPELLARFRELAERNPEDRFEFVCVDDGSRDNSFAVLTELAASEPRLRVVKLSRNFGSTAALLAGLGQARGDVVAGISADLQDPPELIHDMLAHWRKGRKVVLAARNTRGDSGLVSLLADAFYLLFRAFALRAMPRRGFDFFLIDRQVCDLVNHTRENNTYLMGLILWFGFDPVVIPYHRRAREARFGRSMWTLSRKLKHFFDSFVAFSFAPVRLASLLGVLLSLGGVVYAAVVLACYLCLGTSVPGWTSLMVVLLLTSGTQLLMLGIFGEYLCRNLDESRQRPRYIVERCVDGSAADADPEPRKVA